MRLLWPAVPTALLLTAVFVGLAATPAAAGYQTCNGQPVASDVRHCPDGSPPIFHSGSPDANPIVTPNAVPTPNGGGSGNDGGHARNPGGTITAPPTAKPPIVCNDYGHFLSRETRPNDPVHVPFVLASTSTAYDAAGQHVQIADAGARGGVLAIRSNGRYTWRSRTRNFRGSIGAFAPSACAQGHGVARVAVTDGRATYYIVSDGATIGLFNIATGYLTYEGRPS